MVRVLIIAELAGGASGAEISNEISVLAGIWTLNLGGETQLLNDKTIKKLVEEREGVPPDRFRWTGPWVAQRSDVATWPWPREDRLLERRPCTLRDVATVSAASSYTMHCTVGYYNEQRHAARWGHLRWVSLCKIHVIDNYMRHNYRHTFIHTFWLFYSISSSPLLLRGPPDYSIDTVSESTRQSATGNCEWRTCPRSLRGD